MTKTAPVTIHMPTENVEFVAELVHQSRREAQDAGDVETAARCDVILHSLGFELPTR